LFTRRLLRTKQVDPSFKLESPLNIVTPVSALKKYLVRLSSALAHVESQLKPNSFLFVLGDSPSKTAILLLFQKKVFDLVFIPSSGLMTWDSYFSTWSHKFQTEEKNQKKSFDKVFLQVLEYFLQLEGKPNLATIFLTYPSVAIMDTTSQGYSLEIAAGILDQYRTQLAKETKKKAKVADLIKIAIPHSGETSALAIPLFRDAEWEQSRCIKRFTPQDMSNRKKEWITDICSDQIANCNDDLTLLLLALQGSQTFFEQLEKFQDL